MLKDKVKPEDECTLPPDEPAPPEILAQYTLNHDAHEEAEIASYVNGQCRGDETVQHLELVKTEYVLGSRYDVWDVHTDKQRWWVLTDLTNLYPQKHFPSLDYTLSFHIGLMQRMRSRDSRSREVDPFDEVYRRRDEASDLLERAVEAEDFQAVGMRLRECLIALVGSIRSHLTFSPEAELPKSADVLGWNELLINHFCAGESKKTLRQYLKAAAERTWQLVNWLTHDRDANKTEAVIVQEAVSVLIGHFSWLTVRDRVDLVGQCPQCSSRDIRSYYDSAIEPEGAYYERCRACDWNNHPGYNEAPASS